MLTSGLEHFKHSGFRVVARCTRFPAGDVHSVGGFLWIFRGDGTNRAEAWRSSQQHSPTVSSFRNGMVAERATAPCTYGRIFCIKRISALSFLRERMAKPRQFAHHPCTHARGSCREQAARHAKGFVAAVSRPAPRWCRCTKSDTRRAFSRAATHALCRIGLDQELAKIFLNDFKLEAADSPLHSVLLFSCTELIPKDRHGKTPVSPWESRTAARTRSPSQSCSLCPGSSRTERGRNKKKGARRWSCTWVPSFSLSRPRRPDQRSSSSRAHRENTEGAGEECWTARIHVEPSISFAQESEREGQVPAAGAWVRVGAA